MPYHYASVVGESYKDKKFVKGTAMNHLNYSRSERNNFSSSFDSKIVAFVLGVIATTIFYAIFHTNANYNLFTWDFNNLEWSKAWLLTTVIDFYGATIPLIAIVFYTEKLPYALLWTIGFCLLGSPVHITYAIYRLLVTGTIGLKSTTGPEYSGLD